jgi:K+-transporting ATPase ATPase B chain
LIIVALVPLALRGVRYIPGSAKRHAGGATCSFMGFGGIVAPFVGIKIIDLLISIIPGMS